MYLDLSNQDLVVLVAALNSYQEALSEREHRHDYWFRSHVLVDRKNAAEDNKVMLLSRMAQVDRLRAVFMSYVDMGLSFHDD